jgi:hypothetical protein
MIHPGAEHIVSRSRDESTTPKKDKDYLRGG